MLETFKTQTSKPHRLQSFVAAILAALLTVTLFHMPVFAYQTEQNQLTLHEKKIISPAFGTAVGRVIVPDGWSVQVQDLTLGTESITWPNAVLVTVANPDQSCVLTYVSRREFQQKYYQVMGFESASEDDSYDYGTLYHMLDYRMADACCDLMCLVLYGDTETRVMKEYDFSNEEKADIQQGMDKYEKSVSDTFALAKQYNIDLGELMLCQSSVSKRKYENKNGEIIILASSCGFGMRKEFLDSITDTIVWDMPAVYGICANDVEAYEELFDVFCAVTTVSEEYNEMCSQTAARLVQEYVAIQSGTGTGGYSFNDSGSYSDIESSTVDEGDTYSAFEAWDDLIRDETDYTTGSGEHVKIDMNYDHVFELDNGDIFATNSVDAPAGSIELSPTQIVG